MGIERLQLLFWTFHVQMFHIPMFADTIDQLGIVLGSLYFILLNLNLFQYINWFTLLHLSYYSISYRINSLTLLIDANINKNEKEINVSTTPSDLIKRIKTLRTCGYLFDKLCQAANEINSTFSLSVLVILTLIMTLCSTSLFLSIHAMSEVVVHSYIRNAVFLFPGVFTLGLVIMLIILTTVDQPITQVV